MLPDKLNINAIILAAGSASRMKGKVKQLLEFRGKTLLRRAADAAIEAEFSKVSVIVGANGEKISEEVKNLPVEVVFNENWKSGISSSIKSGLTNASADTNAVVFMLCDQPLVTAEILRNLREVFVETDSPIVACEYENTIGVPALFSREFFPALMDLQKDEGAKKIIAENIPKTVVLKVSEAGFDVDTIEDYVKLLHKPFSSRS